MTAATIRAGAPPGQNGDAQGWRASGVWKLLGKLQSEDDLTTTRARWIAYAVRRRARRRLRHARARRFFKEATP